MLNTFEVTRYPMQAQQLARARCATATGWPGWASRGPASFLTFVVANECGRWPRLRLSQHLGC
jgi:hypothetical protein